ncbi:hypothetical protein SEVIR_2G101701v4 [Setaria viridis]
MEERMRASLFPDSWPSCCSPEERRRRCGRRGGCGSAPSRGSWSATSRSSRAEEGWLQATSRTGSPTRRTTSRMLCSPCSIYNCADKLAVDNNGYSDGDNRSHALIACSNGNSMHVRCHSKSW